MINYFDNCATTRVDDDVLQILNKFFTEMYFNPSSLNKYSLEVARYIADARSRIAIALGASSPSEIVFVSGGTEADNLALLGSPKRKNCNIVVGGAEHSAVYNTAMKLKNSGIDVRFCPVTTDGHTLTEEVAKLVDENTSLVAIMHVNNETGAVNDVKSIVSAVKKINPTALVFSDGVQAVGKIPVYLSNLGVDLYSFSGHKIHASKGTGCLYVRRRVSLNPVLTGGGQESNLRSGTEYVGGIVSLAVAVEKAVASVEEHSRAFNRFKQIIADKLQEIPMCKVNCSEDVSPAIMSVAFAKIKSEVLMHMLENSDIIVGMGSACSSKNKHSRILSAISLGKDYIEGVVRISFSKYNTEEQVRYLAEKLKENVSLLRKTMGVRF